ncbi:hypothetical protein [Streptomyces sp. NPDC017556]|uniref:hypothetical protein n=1 Tax=unclassified Streptomyces TaxID=2593676 RepID=UPI0037BB8A4F
MSPELMRPGRADVLTMVPHRRLLSLDEHVEHTAAKPLIVPEMIVCDHGEVFVAHNFRASCRLPETDCQPTHEGAHKGAHKGAHEGAHKGAHKGAPLGKGHIEQAVERKRITGCPHRDRTRSMSAHRFRSTAGATVKARGGEHRPSDSTWTVVVAGPAPASDTVFLHGVP